MDERYARRKGQLLEQEQRKQKERSIIKRLGQKLPEESIKPPKIGEWQLGSVEQFETASTKGGKAMSTLGNISQKPNKISSKSPKPNATYVFPKSKSNMIAPFMAKPPRVSDSVNCDGPKTTFPAGTVTTNLNDILRSKYKQPNRPLPPLESTDVLQDPQFLPLELFDDSTFEEFPLEELMKTPQAYSRFQELNGDNYWAKCTVLNYDEDSGVFLIEWDGTGRRKKVARFNLRFARENPKKFEERINHAKKACALTETALRFESRISQMPVENLPELSPDNIQGIHDKINIVLQDKEKVLLQELDEEVSQEFKNINNRLDFIYDLKTNPLIPNRDEFLLLIPNPKPAPEYGLIEHPKYSFPELLEVINDVYLMAQPNIQKGLFTIWQIFQDSEKITFLTSGYDEIISLEEFVHRQYNHLTTTTKDFKKAIQDTLDGVIGSTVNDQTAPKKDRQRYKNMVTLTTRMLHTVQLHIVATTLKEYNGIFKRYTKKDTKTDKLKPQFIVQLLLNKEKKLSFDPSIDDFHTSLLKLLQQLEEAVNELPIIKSALFEVDSNSVSFEDCCEIIRAKKKKLDEILQILLTDMRNFIKEREFLEGVLSLDPIEYTKSFDPNGTRTLNEYRTQLAEFNRVLNIIQNEMKSEYVIDLFHISCEQFKVEKTAHIRQLIFEFLSQVKRLALGGITDLKNEFDNIADTLKKIPNTPEELAAMKKYLEQVYDTAKNRNKLINIANERFAFLEEFQFEVTNEEFQFRYQTLQMPQKISVTMDETERTLSVERIRMIRELRANQRKLETETESLTEQLTAFAAKYNDLEMTVEAVDQINEINTKLVKLREEQDKYNVHEKLFEFEQVTSRVLQKLIEDFTPLHVLWNLASEWTMMHAMWLDTPFPQIHADTINQFIIQSTKKITKLKKELNQQRTLVEKVLNPLSTQIEAFKQNVPLIIKLRHPGIKTKHWEMISEVVGFKINQLELSLQGFLNLDLGRWNDQISEIASVAAQEYSLELTLDQMDAELQTKQFITGLFRDSGQYILHEIDDITSIIDDQLVTTQTLLTSPFVAPVKKRATERLAFLRLCSESLEAWISCQRSWLYLQPIFSGTSIQQKLHKEAQDWANVDKLWSGVMTMTHTHPDFNNVMHRETLLPSLQQCNELLDNITRGLNEYLETKRLGFPRFFFLSNDELISILSHTKDFSKIQDSMQKLFEYVNSITVTSNSEITHMNDSEGESVQLVNPVNGNTPEIEDWLNAFEEEMKNTIKEYVGDSIPAYSKKKREYWIADFPAQVILMTNQIMWTQQVTNVLMQQKLRGLKVLQGKFIEQLEALTALVRQPISKLIRQVVSCLLIFEVHNRDIISSLIQDEVSDVESFKWQQQLRYYWEDDTIMVRSINNSYEYSYEYAGNSARLVITPLTDRCYQTLLSAFKMNLSGAPSGPAGTGKTETARDCAKALGRACVVYNCSEEVTPEQMSQFFAGLSSSGSWSCFDEFNRINIEVLSVIAQQVRTIQEAIAANVERFKLDARDLKLNPNAAIIITMNPGYAGRTELPDNLKAVFRPCAMMVPDFVFISEILLFSGGFKTASTLSIKLVALFDLCRKQLSNAHHYDWGLRAMKAILSTAGKAKRNDLEADEATLLVNVIRDCTAPRLVSADLPLFAGIIHDVFPEVVGRKGKDQGFIDSVKNAFLSLNCHPQQVYVSKCIELYETTLVRHGIMLVGGSLGGKTVSWKALAQAMTDRAKAGIDKPVHTESLNPKAISIAELYGSFNPVTSEWADGVLSKSIRQCSFSEQTELKWIIVDGPVDSLWIETMNSLLDDNKVLCLPNNERIQLGPHVKMVFEVDDLSEASPATVSRCGMVFFDPLTMPWKVLTDSWTSKLKDNENLTTFFKTVFDLYMPKLVQFIDVDAKTAIKMNPNYCVTSMLKLLDSYLPLLRTEESKVVEGDEVVKSDPLEQELYGSLFAAPEQIPLFTGDSQITAMERAFIFSVIWSFGGVIPNDQRSVFDNFLKNLMETNQAKCVFPPKDTVFDYYADFGRSAWTPWCDNQTNMSLTDKKPIEEMLIPTPEVAAPLYLARLLLSNHFSLLFQGQESSKTLIAKTLFDCVLDKKKYDTHTLPLASCSQPSNISKFMIQFMHKRQGQFGPLPNQHLIFLLDNMGAVKPEIYGAQPALELVRQFFDYGGWFQTSPVEFLNIIGTSIIGTMGVQGGGLYGLPDRLTRHFIVVHLPKYNMDTIKYITTNLMSKALANYNGSIREVAKESVSAMIDLYEQCQKKLLPIPSKLHYVFNLRNIVHVIRGIVLVKPNVLDSEAMFQKLWHHEMSREFTDRFNAINDRKWFESELNKAYNKVFKQTWESVCPTNFCLFNEFSDTSYTYKEASCTQDELLATCNGILEEHNREAQKTIDIVLFHEAVVHLSALSRIFAMRRGHALLVGVKASGRKSLAKLALHMASIDPFEIAITRTYGFNEWREDMKNLLKQCGVSDIPTGFIISDVQIMNTQQLEDISNLLANCEIPQLFERDEIEGIKADLANADMATGGFGSAGTDYWEQFMSRVKKNLHIILVFSPYGTMFKDAMLSFPAVRNETTIDWYMPWSQNALESVAHASLTKAKVGEPEMVKSMVSVCVRIHKSVEEIATVFLKETKRFTAVTPSRYFELLATFISKLESKQKETTALIANYENGVEKITTTRQQIESMSQQLDRDIPVLKKTKAEVAEMMEELKIKSAEVEETKKEVEGQRQIAEKEAKEANETNQIAQAKFADAQPLLIQAQEAVLRLDKDSLVNIKKLHQPSDGMKETFEAVCIMLGRQPRKVNGPTPGSKVDDYWPEVVSMLNEIGFIKMIQNFKIEDIKKETINKLKKYVPADLALRQEKRNIAMGSFAAVGALYDWVCASYEYWIVYQEILPLKLSADEAARKLAASQEMLAKAQAHLDEVEAKLKDLRDNFQKMQDKEKELTENVASTQARLERAKKIMSGLSGETTRWSETAKNLRNSAQYIMGDSLLISGALTYLAVFSPKFRTDILNKWKEFLTNEKITFNSEFSIQHTLGNDGTIRDWIVKGLPNDTHSIENALIITHNEMSFPLLIDPQLSGTKWLRNIEGEHFVILHFDQPDFIQRLKNCVSFGMPVLIENVGLKLDPLIDPILSRELSVVDGVKKITLAGEQITYSDSFRLYISTKYPNPHYSPEVCSQVTLVNFTTTQDGLTDLLLNNLIEVEREDLDRKRIAIMEASAANTKKLKEIENEILQIVSNAGSDILDDDNAIITLQRAQATSKDIEQQLADSRVTEKEINEFKAKFLPVAERAALLYFCISDFSVIDPMYQFSLKWFVNLFRSAITSAPHPEETTAIINAFHDSIATTFYESVSYSLFSRHKLLFSALMAFRIHLSLKNITGSELAFMLSPQASSEPNPTTYLTDDVWQIAAAMKNASPVFADIAKSLVDNADQWYDYCESNEPELMEIPYPHKLSSFQKLLVLRVFHLQRVREGLHIFIEENMGKKFVTPPTLKLQNVFNTSDPLSPLIFIIMPGIDPQDEIIGVAQSMETEKYFKSYSLGRGRGAGAEELINSAAEKGFWVLLQNCHLSLSWMPRLENIINNLNPEKVHPRFRLCLVTMSSPDFPIGILYQGTKLIYEIPKGMRENVMRIYSGFIPEEYDANENVVEKRLAFHLAFFHAVVLERLQFGSIGWNIPYEFNPSDYNISRRHLRIFLGEAQNGEIPFEALSYVIGELNYGGRVTDRWDRRLLLSLLGRFFSEDINSSDFSFGERYSPPKYDAPLHDLMNTISGWPVVTAGEDVGLSMNASTITARNEAMKIFNSLIEVQPTLVAATDSISEEQFALNLVESLIEQIPKPFNVHNFKKKFNLEDMVSTVLHHEILLYNRLIETISESLSAMRNGLMGLILIDDKLETLNKRLLANRVPEIWLEKSFPSILSLRNYMSDLNQRVSFLDHWVRLGAPVVYRLGAFFHPEEFLTAILQLYARRHSVPFDSLSWTTTPLEHMTAEHIATEPEEGIYIEGLPIEGAKWDTEQNCLVECGQRELVSVLPVIHLQPTQDKNVYDMRETYECPVFRTQNRGTGALDLPNYIISLYLPSANVSPDHWVQRSVAAFITTQ